MAEGYTSVQFSIMTWGSKSAKLFENTTQIEKVTSNGYVDFGEITLTENAYYYIRLYYNITDEDKDVVIKAVFS
jgi:hypothetical protein